MEHARHWMWTKRKEPSGTLLQAPIKPSYDDSWEEQAFAEDTAGALGGCIWPPRSYSCNFCGREFRSAQALGGHMNVHRRDRARLKQSPSSQSEILQQDHQKHHSHLQNSYTCLGFQYPPQICTLVYSSPNPSSDLGSIVSPSSPSRISTTPTQESSTKKVSLFTPLSSSITEAEQNKSSSPRSSKPLWPNLDAEKCYLSNPNPMSNDGEKISILTSRNIDQSGCRAKVDYLKTDLSVSLKLVVRRTCPITILDDVEEKKKEETNGSKRRRIDSSPFFCKSNNSVECHSPWSIEELDLELRLGDRPKVE